MKLGKTDRSRPLIILTVAMEDEARLGAQIVALAALSGTCSCRILAAGDTAALNRRHADALAAAKLGLIEPMPGRLSALRETVLAGRVEDVDSVALVGDLAHLTLQIAREAEAVIVGCGETEAAPSVALGCTLVTSVFRSDPFLRGFINNSEALRGYDRLIDHIFLVAKLSEIEIAAFQGLLTRRRNTVILWNRQDPGLYNCWNQGIRMARRDYVSNANVDDLRDPAHVVTLMADLEAHPDAMVAATALNPFYEFPEDGTLPENREGWYADLAGYFGFYDLGRLSEQDPPRLEPHNIPHCMPVWRRTLHSRFGWFDEARYGTFADWAFWLKVTQDGGRGLLNPAKLSFYFVNPTSHNRRGNDLERLHRVVEGEFIGQFLARRAGRPNHRARTIPDVPRKLVLTGRTDAFGQHRNSFNALVRALDPLDRGDGSGVRFVPFLERYFVWGDQPGEAGSSDPRPITEPWIGILHVPFDAPEWFDVAVSPERFLAQPLFQRSRASCRGIITLARDLEADLNAFDPGLPTLSVLHPTGYDAKLFDVGAYRAEPKVVQVGDWLRKLQAIHRMRTPGHKRIMLLKQWTQTYLEREIAQFGDARDPAVEMVNFVPNDRYDALLSSSVVLCLLYGTAANNVVIECIARATPILINPLPAVVEYLGRDYPLYVTNEAEADAALAASGRIEEAHAYLLSRREEVDLTYEGFCRDIAGSGLYARL